MHWFGSHAGPGPGFSFTLLYNLAKDINASDPHNSSIYHPDGDLSKLALTYAACKAAVGTEWSPYETRGVYDRLILWRVPLIALIATTTLPALGFWRQVFTVAHLVADPIDTFWSLFYKLTLAERLAAWAKEANVGSRFTQGSNSIPEDHTVFTAFDLGELRQQPTMLSDGRERQLEARARRNAGNKELAIYDLDAIAVIVNAYQEWHFGEHAKQVFETNFELGRWCRRENLMNFRDRCTNAAELLAADRVSTQVPALVATAQFIIVLFASFFKTLTQLDHSADPDNSASIGVNQTPHNIAFGTLFFWIPFAVLETAFIGGAQTTNSVPRILNNLRRDVADLRKQDTRDWRLAHKLQENEKLNRDNEALLGAVLDTQAQTREKQQDLSTNQQWLLLNGQALSEEGLGLLTQPGGATLTREPSPQRKPSEESKAPMLAPARLEDFPLLRFGMAQRWSQGVYRHGNRTNIVMSSSLSA